MIRRDTREGTFRILPGLLENACVRMTNCFVKVELSLDTRSHKQYVRAFLWERATQAVSQL